MDIISAFRDAMMNLVSAKLRSFLAILGVLVGTGAVVALISSSQLATDHALAQFKKLGTNLMSIYLRDRQELGSSHQETQFMYHNVADLKKASSEITLVAPYILGYQSAYFGDTKLNGEVIGATESFGKVAKLSVARGRFVSYLDNRNFYCVIGNKVAQKIKNTGEDPLNKQIRVGNTMFTVIGILKKWPNNLFIASDLNNSMIIPLRTAYVINSHAQINNIIMRLQHHPNIALVQKQVTRMFQQLLPKKKAMFISPKEIIKLVAKERQTYAWLLIAIGCISLVVGGIGVMNIMLVSVVERRREIGIRMAIGARQSDILKLFLVEAVMLTVFGGLLGVIVGELASFILAFFTHWTFYFFVMPVVLGFFVSVLVGILSGFYPAWRASTLDPIESLMAE